MDHRALIPGDVPVDPTWAFDGWDVEVFLDADTGFAVGSPYGFAVTQTYQPKTLEDSSHVIQAGELSSQNCSARSKRRPELRRLSTTGAVMSCCWPEVMTTADDSWSPRPTASAHQSSASADSSDSEGMM